LQKAHHINVGINGIVVMMSFLIRESLFLVIKKPIIKNGNTIIPSGLETGKRLKSIDETSHFFCMKARAAHDHNAISKGVSMPESAEKRKRGSTANSEAEIIPANFDFVNVSEIF
jgi:hypothetical protein